MSSPRIYNTLTRSKSPLIPIKAGRLKIYVCGPTVYDDPHLGHARSAVIFDVIRRYLRARGYSVTLVRNVTDIDDKILIKARRRNQDFGTVGTHYLRRYEQAMQRLNVKAPDARPKVTGFIGPIRDFISGLLQAGHAYAAGGSVYFGVTSCKHYGKLSRRTIAAAVMDGNASVDPFKRHPADFVLWKAAKPREPFWTSPWGPGRPGWHIGCSAMSARLLGEVYDIHGGGQDLIFPHHENEIAQSESLFRHPPANYWMHHGLVHLNGCKISKSLGHFQALNHLLGIYPPDALRLFLISKRYRHPMAFSHQGMEIVLKHMDRIRRFFSRWKVGSAAFEEGATGSGTLWTRFCGAMDDDFNFPMALSIVFEGMRNINGKLGLNPDVRSALKSRKHMTAIFDLYVICKEIFGLNTDDAPGVTTGKPISANMPLVV